MRRTKPRQISMMSIQKRMIIAFGVIILLFCVLAFNTGRIQIIDTELYASKAASAQMTDEVIRANRGDIFDAKGELLATSSTTYRLWVRLDSTKGTHPMSKKEDERQKIATKKLLVAELGLDEAELNQQFDEKRPRIRVAKGITIEQMEKISSGIKANELSIVEAEAEQTRTYPLGTMAAHALGSVNGDGYGQSGLEMQYDAYLSGVSGRRKVNTDSRGNTLATSKGDTYTQKDGLNLVTTIDETVQYYVETAMAEVLEKTKANQVMTIVMNPKNGDILAMSKLPTYDPNSAGMPYKEEDKQAFIDMNAEDQTKYLSEMWRNPMVNDIYEPGSTFKLVTVSSALETGSINLTDTVQCAGHFQVGPHDIKCWSYPVAHGTQDISLAVKNSCNPGMIQIGQKMGFDQFYKYIELYGFTGHTGIDLPGEADAIYYKPQGAKLADLANMSFGQSISITPIQLATAVSAILNDGKLVQPRLVSKMIDDQKNTVITNKKKTVRQVISKQTADEMRGIMQFVVDNGGGGVVKIPGYKIGAKSGTAQKIGPQGYESGRVVSSLLAALPMDDPQFLILMIVDEPKGESTFGSTTAGPGVRSIIDNLIKYYNLRPEYTQEEKDNQAQGTHSVPQLTGMSVAEAKAVLSAQEIGCSVDGNASGDKIVSDQYPKSGNKLEKNGKVFLYVE